jgi:hypothetical protein
MKFILSVDIILWIKKKQFNQLQKRKQMSKNVKPEKPQNSLLGKLLKENTNSDDSNIEQMYEELNQSTNQVKKLKKVVKKDNTQNEKLIDDTPDNKKHKINEDKKVDEISKLCRKCNVVKLKTEFSKHGGTADKLDNRCKACVKEMKSRIKAEIFDDNESSTTSDKLYKRCKECNKKQKQEIKEKTNK